MNIMNIHKLYINRWTIAASLFLSILSSYSQEKLVGPVKTVIMEPDTLSMLRNQLRTINEWALIGDFEIE